MRHIVCRFDPDRDFLGKGSFGRVFTGRCRGQEVAVKIPAKQALSAKDLQAFRHEVLMMSKIFHPHVVLFLGSFESFQVFLLILCEHIQVHVHNRALFVL